MAKLGANQEGAWEALKRHGQWWSEGIGCGWVWSDRGRTKKLMESLVKKGLVTKTKEDYREVYRPVKGA